MKSIASATHPGSAFGHLFIFPISSADCTPSSYLLPISLLWSPSLPPPSHAIFKSLRRCPAHRRPIVLRPPYFFLPAPFRPFHLTFSVRCPAVTVPQSRTHCFVSSRICSRRVPTPLSPPLYCLPRLRLRWTCRTLMSGSSRLQALRRCRWRVMSRSSPHAEA